VLVLFFAVFVGTWSPLTWSVGYSSGRSSVATGQPSQSPSPLNLPAEQAMGPDIQQPISDPYSTPNSKSDSIAVKHYCITIHMYVRGLY